MTFEQPDTLPTRETPERDSALAAAADRFLGEQSEYLSQNMIKAAEERARDRKQEILKGNTEERKDTRAVTYNRHKKAFSVNGQSATMGEIIASRHLGINIDLPLDEKDAEGKSKLSLAERTLREQYAQSAGEDVLFDELNRDLAGILSETEKRKDLLKSEAYAEISKRSGIESKQLGVLAEKIMIGFAETIAIDRPDLGLSVASGNAFQDVEQKIDFILETTRKKRGVGINEEELPAEHKSIGIQFTINTAKEGSKLDQIAKAKERGMTVDDILYIAIDKKTLSEAVDQWEKKGKPVSGPLQFMPKIAQKKAVMELFADVLEAQQLEGLLKKFA